jgi:diguanylate cyclase (GGDEF)-like protein
MGENQALNNRILIIDDTETIHQDFRKTLTSGDPDPNLDAEAEALFGNPAPSSDRREFSLDSAMQGEEGYAKVESALSAGRPYAVAFVDMRMPPGWDGVQTIEQLWKVDPRLQVVICTAYADYAWDEIVQRLGVSDRLLILKKPFDSVEARQLALALTEKWEMTQQAMLKLDELERIIEDRTTELRHAAGHDMLTGLANRSGLTERLRQLLERSNREAAAVANAPAASEFAVLFLDFDRFKVVNDGLGHEVGDQLLVSISRRLCSVLAEPFGQPVSPDQVMAARLGGDEFVVLIEMPDAAANACKLADRLLDSLRAGYSLLGHQVFSTASIGITTSNFDYCRADDVLRDADAAMYAAKAAGKDRYVVFDRSMHDHTLTRLQMETDLRNSLVAGDFACAFQPVVSLGTGEVQGFEALLRWKHPIRGQVPPIDFIPVAEDTGLIQGLGKWILEDATRQLASWLKRPNSAPMFVAVNMSKRQLLDPSVDRAIADLLESTGLAPECLKLEVTESIIMDRAEAVTPILHRLKKLGVQIWMDDFGTGHSSLSCMHTFPLDGLKIDRGFIRNLDMNPRYQAVVQAIVTLAKNLRLTIVAEGIETPQQAVLMQDLGCDFGQGYLFARPAFAADCEAFIENRKITMPFPSEAPAAAAPASLPEAA